jgi:hypothetical protein
MYGKGGSRLMLTMVLVLLLATPALAGPQKPAVEGPDSAWSTLWQRVVDWLDLGWGSLGGASGEGTDHSRLLDSLQCEKGTAIDPNGGCINGAGTVNPGEIDPDR